MEEKKKGHLSCEERRLMYVMLKEGEGFRAIGRELGRSASTIKREAERNAAPRQIARRMTPLEKAKYAQEKAEHRRRERVRKRGSRLDRRADVRVRLLALLKRTNYSPEYIAYILSQSDLGVKLCGRTIRNWVKKNCPAYQQHFPHRGKRPVRHLTPKRRGPKRPDVAAPKRSIHTRPEEANARLRAGDFELDMVVCRQSTVSILSIRDRKTRTTWLELVPDLKAETVRRAIIRFIHTIPPPMRNTLTFDRGTEFAQVHQLEQFFGLLNYFCDAYSAWQKGAVENQNKEIRRYLPKGTDLSTISYERLKRIEALLNAKPRRCLGGFSALDSWMIEARKLQHELH
jgi:IS30 family transposase